MDLTPPFFSTFFHLLLPLCWSSILCFLILHLFFLIALPGESNHHKTTGFQSQKWHNSVVHLFFTQKVIQSISHRKTQLTSLMEYKVINRDEG